MAVRLDINRVLNPLMWETLSSRTIYQHVTKRGLYDRWF